MISALMVLRMFPSHMAKFPMAGDVPMFLFCSHGVKWPCANLKPGPDPRLAQFARRFPGRRPLLQRPPRSRILPISISLKAASETLIALRGGEVRAEVGRHEQPSAQSPQQVSGGTKTKSGT